LEIAMADDVDEPDMETGLDEDELLGVEPPATKDNSAPQVSNPARDARVVAAELKLKQYRQVRRKGAAATPAQLRAYFIWHINEDLKPEAIAALLRDPPLQKHTVTTYILKAVTSDSLPYDKSRMRNEILSLLHPSVQAGSMYQDLIKCCMDTSSGT
jgi:exonuclease 3'-5' domain-containing protein 2